MNDLRFMLLLFAILPLSDVSLPLLRLPPSKLIHISCVALSVRFYDSLVLIYGCETMCRRWRRLGSWLRRLWP
jgi:hypothetical protein